jgi:flagellar biosynthesis GTPase FlhF
LLLVEPKKCGRSFRDIINGQNLHLTRTNTQVYTRQPTTLRAPPVFTYKLAELTGEETVINHNQTADEEKKRAEQQDKLSQLRAKANAAAAAAAAEREKMEALIAKKKTEALIAQKKMEEEKMEQARLEQQEAQRLIREKERKARELEEYRKQKAREEAEAARQEQLLREEREREIANMHRNVIMSQLCNRWISQLLENVIEEKVIQSTKKLIKTRDYIKRTAKPIVQRVRQRIEKRNAKALERHHFWNMNMAMIYKNPYSSLGSLKQVRPLHSTPEGIRERVQQSILAEKYALEDLKHVSNINISCDLQIMLIAEPPF